MSKEEKSVMVRLAVDGTDCQREANVPLPNMSHALSDFVSQE